MYYQFLKTQYKMHKLDPTKGIDKETLHSYVPKRISEEEYLQILKEVDGE